MTSSHFGDKVTAWYRIKTILNYIENRILHIYTVEINPNVSILYKHIISTVTMINFGK